MPTDPWTVPADRIASIMVRHKPRYWRVVQSKRKTAEADRYDWMNRGDGKRIIRVPYVVDLWTLYLYLHECGHVNRGHWSDRFGAPAHVEEWESELYALHTLLAEGLPVPKEFISNGKEYVRSHANKDAVSGIATDPRVAKWLGTKGL